jgi:anti-sigma-K factor RskA
MNGMSPDDGRDAVEDLLPWYANGRLSTVERRRVEAALAEDDELARRLELVREEMAATIAANKAIRPASARAFERLMAGIEATPQPQRPFAGAAARAGLVDRLGGFLAALAPRRLAYVAAAAVAVVAVQAAVLGGMLGTRDGYQTASQGEPAVAGATILVAFTPGAKIEDVAAFLKRHGVERAEGPKANGFFRLRLAADRDAAVVARAMTAETGIVSFVQVTP